MTPPAKFCQSSSNNIVDVVMWSNLVTLAFMTREVIITQILYVFDHKTDFEGWSWFKFNNWRLVLGMAMIFYRSVAKGLKLKVRKCWEKLVGGLFASTLLPSCIGLKMNWQINVLWKPLKKRSIGFTASLPAVWK